MNKRLHDPVGSNAVQFPLSMATTASSWATTSRLGVVAGLAPVVAVGELTAIVGLAELADEAELMGGLDEGAEWVAVCPALLAHATRMIARTARATAPNDLGTLIMSSVRPQFALIP